MTQISLIFPSWSFSLKYLRENRISPKEKNESETRDNIIYVSTNPLL